MVLDDMRPQDEAQIYELMTQLEGDPLPYAQFERVFTAYLADEAVRCIVAREDENVLGFASVHTRMLMHHASPVSELQELVVAESCRGRGIGSALLEASKREAVRRKSPQLELCCNLKNTAAQGFYERSGMSWTHRKYLWKPEK